MPYASVRNHNYGIGDPVIFRRAGRGLGTGTVSAILPCGSLLVDVPGEGAVQGERSAFRPIARSGTPS